MDTTEKNQVTFEVRNTLFLCAFLLILFSYRLFLHGVTCLQAVPVFLSTGLATPKESTFFSVLRVDTHWIYLCHVPDPDLNMVATGVP